MRQIRIDNLRIKDKNSLWLVAGPCVIESESMCLDIARRIKDISKRLDIPFIFKASFDKANRLSIDSYRGPGLEKGLEILNNIKQKLQIPLLSDVHCRADIEPASRVLDVIQIPAFLCRQTDIVIAAAKTKKVVNIKKGQFLAPADILPIIKKIESTGNRRILITERGVCFGYNNLVSDLRSLAIIQRFGYPVIYDATHSVQLPGGRGMASGGQREFVAGFTRAAVAFGCQGLFLEVHPNPDKALCDGPNMISLRELERVLITAKKIRKAVSRHE